MKVQRLFKKMLMSPSIIPDGLRYRILRSQVKAPEHPKGVHFKTAMSRQELYGAFRLLHDAYVEEGMAVPQPKGVRATVYHTVPTTRVLIAKQDDRVVATISVIRDGFWGLPADEIMDLSCFRDRGESLAELSSLAVAPEFRGNSGQMLFCLLKYLVNSTLKESGIDRVVVCVRPFQASLYEALFGFSRFSRKVIDDYGFGNGVSVICSTIEIPKLSEIFYRLYCGAPPSRNLYHYCFERLTSEEKELMDTRVKNDWDLPYLDRDSFVYLFNHCTALYSEMTDDQKDYLDRLYAVSA